MIEASQFQRAHLDKLFLLANKIRFICKNKEGSLFLSSLLAHRNAMLYFTQPSTRTFLSFQTACHLLGMRTSEIRSSELSSEKKGESLFDSIRTFSSYVDLIVMRSPVANLSKNAAKLLDNTPRPVPIINGGSGPDEHPTQALLDVYTLQRCFELNGGLDGKTICMVGDLKRGRTIRSLALMLASFRDITIFFISPKEFGITDEFRRLLMSKENINFIESEDFVAGIKCADAIYMTRLQDEYDDLFHLGSYDTERYSLKYDDLKYVKNNAVILHPMPRRSELDVAIDSDSRAQYWRQERNGMWIRTALIATIFHLEKDILGYNS